MTSKRKKVLVDKQEKWLLPLLLLRLAFPTLVDLNLFQNCLQTPEVPHAHVL